MTPSMKLILLFAALNSRSIAAPVNDDVATAKDGSKYDYIIVGGGLSGLVVANRLTENRKGMSALSAAS